MFSEVKKSSPIWNILIGVYPWRIISSVTSRSFFSGNGVVKSAIFGVRNFVLISWHYHLNTTKHLRYPTSVPIDCRADASESVRSGTPAYRRTSGAACTARTHAAARTGAVFVQSHHRPAARTCYHRTRSTKRPRRS